MNVPIRKLSTVFLIQLIVLAGLAYLCQGVSFAASREAYRDDWSGIGSYSTKDANVAFTTFQNKDRVTLSPQTFHDNAYDYTGNFPSSSAEPPVNVIPTPEGNLTLKPVIDSPFVSNLKEWATLPTMPKPGEYSAYTHIILDGHDYIYCLFASGDGTQFARLDLDAAYPRWEFLSPFGKIGVAGTPKTVGAGCALTNDGVNTIYGLRGSGSKEVYQYDIATDAWSKLNTNDSYGFLSVGATLGADIVYVGVSSKKLVAIAGGGKSDFFYFHPTQNKWYRADVNDGISNINISAGGKIAYPGGDYVYVAAGGNSSKFVKYRLSAGAWSTVSIPSYGPDQVLRNEPLMNFGTDQWSFSNPVNNSSFCYPGRGSKIYAVTEKYLYSLDVTNPDNIVWEQLPNLPDRVGMLSSTLYFKGASGNELHFFSGANYTRPWKFDAGTKKWITLVGSGSPTLSTWQMPNKTWAAGQGMTYCYPGTGNYIYYTSATRVRNRVGNSYADYDTYSPFYRYDITNNTWEQLGDIPLPVRSAGNRLAYADGYIYCLATHLTDTDTTSGFVRFDINQVITPTNHGTWQTLSSFPRRAYSGSSIFAVPANEIDTGLPSTKYYIYGFKATDYNNPTNDGELLVYDPLDDAGGWKTIKPGTISTPLSNPTGYYYNSTFRPRGCFLLYPGSGEYVYASSGDHSNWAFFRYSVKANTWERIYHTTSTDTKNCPLAWDAWGGSVLTYDGTDSIYAFGTYGDSVGHVYRWAKYSISSQTWRELTPISFWARPMAACIAQGAIYAQGGYDSTLYKYDLAAGTWSESLYDRDSAVEGNMAVDSNNNIYMVYGATGERELTSHIWVYSAEKNAWAGLIRAPFKITCGAKAQYIKRTDSIYVAEARGTKNVYRYILSGAAANTWELLTYDPIEAVLGYRPWRGTQIVLDRSSDGTGDGDTQVYLLGGWADSPHLGNQNKKIYNLTINVSGAVVSHYFQTVGSSFNVSNYCAWFSNILEFIGGKLYYLSLENNQFCRSNQEMTAWYTYSIYSEGSEVLTASGAVLFYYKDPESQIEYLYLIPAKSTDKFLRIKVNDIPQTSGTTNWETVYRLPYIPYDWSTSIAMANQSSVVANNKPWFYVFNAKSLRPIRYYPGPKQVNANVFIPDQGAWDEPQHIQTGEYGWRSAACAYKGYIYLLSYNEFKRYNVTTDEWESLATPTFTLDNSQGALIAVEYNGVGYLYTHAGNNTTGFYKYVVSENKWYSTQSPTFQTNMSSYSTWRYGNALVFKDRYIYALRGESGDVSRFDLLTENWAPWFPQLAATSLPVTASTGSSMAIKGNYLYVLAYNNGQTFFLRTIVGDSVINPAWEYKKECPLYTFNSRSTLIYPGFGNYLYLMQGSSLYDWTPSNVILRYNSAIDTGGTSQPWEEIYPGCPFGAKAPGTLLYPGGNWMYVFSRDQYYLGKFMTFAFGTFTSEAKAVGNHSGWGALEWNGTSNNQAITMSVRTANRNDMSDALSWGKVVDLATSADLDTGPVYRDMSSVISVDKESDKYIQYRANFATDNIEQLPVLSSVKLKYEVYPRMQQIVSGAYDGQYMPGNIYNRLVNITWGGDFPKGTDVRFQLNTSDTSTMNPNLFKGPTGTAAKDYLFTPSDLTAGNYAMDSNIEISNNTARLLKTIVYYQTIKLANSNESVLRDYQVKITLPSTHADFWKIVQSDGRDIRFASDEDGDSIRETRLSYWIESFEYYGPVDERNRAVIWVKVPNIPAGTAGSPYEKFIYLMYGNRQAKSESSFEKTMGASDYENGLISSYHFDDGLGTTVTDSCKIDNAGNLTNIKNNGSIKNKGGKWVEGKIGKALDFNNTDYMLVNVNTEKNLTNTTEWTVTGWIKIQPADSQIFFSFDGNNYNNDYYKPMIFASAWGYNPLLYINDGYNETYHRWGTMGLKDNKWHHVAFVFKDYPSSYTMEVYVDGVNRGTPWPSYSPGKALPARNVWRAGSLKGAIDELRVYNRVLSQAEIVTQAQLRTYAAVEPTVTVYSDRSTEPNIFNGWSYRQQARVSYQLPKSSPDQVGIIEISNNPALATYSPSFWTNYTSGSGDDIRVSDGYPMPFKSKVVYFYRDTVAPYTNSKIVLYVKFPHLISLGPQETNAIRLYLYYGNAGAASIANLADLVMKPDILSAYWAFNDSDLVNLVKESTGKTDRDGTASNSLAVLSDEGGKIGRCVKLDATQSPQGTIALQATNANGLGIYNSDFTIVGWVKGASFSSTGKNPILGVDNGSSNKLNIGISAKKPVMDFGNNLTLSDDVKLRTALGITDQGVNPQLNAGEWYHVAFRYNRPDGTNSTGAQEFFINGINVNQASTSHTAYNGYSDVIKIGSAYSTSPSALSYFFNGWIDELAIYSRGLTDDEIKLHMAQVSFVPYFYPSEPYGSAARGYSTIDPVIQPVLGVFYDSTQGDAQSKYKLDSFQELVSPVSATDDFGVKYQCSPDGWHWYWWNPVLADANKWDEVVEGYTNANTAQDINAHLDTFQAKFPVGDFYWRAYFRSSEGWDTPAISQVKVALIGEQTFYTKTAGNVINPLQCDTLGDRYFQYKAILYSDGQNAPRLDWVRINYINPYIDLSFPDDTKEYLNANSPANITWASDGLREILSGASPDSGTLNIWYSLDGGASFPESQKIAGSVLASSGQRSWTVPNVFNEQVKVKVASDQYGLTVYDESTQNSTILAFRLLNPNGGIDPGTGLTQKLELGKTYTMRWTNNGTVTLPLRLYLSKDGGATYPLTLGEPIGNPSNPDDPYKNPGEHTVNLTLLTTDIQYVSNTCRVKISDAANRYDISDGDFIIVPKPTVIMNNLPPEIYAGDIQDISWSTIGNVADDSVGDFTVEYDYSLDGTAGGFSSNWTTVTTPVLIQEHLDNKLYPWEVIDSEVISYNNPQPFTSVLVKLRVGEVNLRSGYTVKVGDSKNVTIKPPELKNFIISNPDPIYNTPDEPLIGVKGDTKWKFAWDRSGRTLDNLSLAYSLDYYQHLGSPHNAQWTVIEEFTKDDYLKPGETSKYEYTWSGGVPQEAVADNVYVSIRDSHAPYPVYDVSGPIKFLPYRKIALENPASTDRLPNGSIYPVNWNWYGEVPSGQTVELTLELSTDGGVTWPDPLNPDVPTTYRKTGINAVAKSTNWTVPDVETTQAKLKLYCPNDPSIEPSYSPVFTITVPTITLVSPVGTSVFASGAYNIGWEVGGRVEETVSVEYRLSTQQGWTNWIVIQPACPAKSQVGAIGNSLTWTIPLSDSQGSTVGRTIEFRVQANDWRPTPGEDSRVISLVKPYGIINPTIQVSSPSATDIGQSAWVVGTPQTITIKTTGAVEEAIKRIKFKCGTAQIGYVDVLDPNGDPLEVILSSTDAAIADDPAQGLAVPCSAPDIFATGNVHTDRVGVVLIAYDSQKPGIEGPSAIFEISVPTFTVTNPPDTINPYIMGVNRNIKWYTKGALVKPFKLYYTPDYTHYNADIVSPDTANWISVDLNITDTNANLTRQGDNYTYAWNPVPDWDAGVGENRAAYSTGKARVKVIDSYNPPHFAVSDGFTLELPQFTVSLPRKPDTDAPSGMWSATDIANIKWSVLGALKGTLKVEWSKTNFASGTVTGDNYIGTVDNTVRELMWSSIPVLAAGTNGSTKVRVRVIDTGWDSTRFPEVGNRSNEFTVLPVPDIQIVSPDNDNKGEENAWRVDTIHRIEWLQNSGLLSNDLEFNYATNLASTDWQPIPKGDVIYNPDTGVRSFDWRIPVGAISSTAAKLRIRDPYPWKKEKVGETYNNIYYSTDPAVTPTFDIAIPRIKVMNPLVISDTYYVALGEELPIQWITEGHVGTIDGRVNTITLEHSENAGATYTGIVSNISGEDIQISGKPAKEYKWTLPTNLTPTTEAKIKISDGGMQYPVRGTDDLVTNKQIYAESPQFTILDTPKIEITSHTQTGETDVYSIGRPLEFSWNVRGLSVKNVKVYYYSLSAPSTKRFPPVGQEIAITCVPNSSNTYTGWILPNSAVVGDDLKLVIMDATRPEIKGISSGTFRVAGGFEILSPVPVSPGENVHWGVNSPQAVKWRNTGTVPTVDLEYSLDGGTTWYPMLNAQGQEALDISNLPDAEGISTFNWTVPPTVTIARNGKIHDVKDNDSVHNALIRISQGDDPKVTRTSDPFSIVYYMVTWKLTDSESGTDLQNLKVTEAGTDFKKEWVDSSGIINSPITCYYPYGIYQTYWKKDGYFDKSPVWSVSSEPLLLEYSMDSEILMQMEWHTSVGIAYNVDLDRLEASAWLERRGKLVGVSPKELSHLGRAVLEIYDAATQDTIAGKTPLKTFTLTQPDSKGMYWFPGWDSTGIEPGHTYWVKATIAYIMGEGESAVAYDYTSGEAFDVTEAKKQKELMTKLTEAEKNITDAVGVATGMVTSQIESTKSSIESKIDSSVIPTINKVSADLTVKAAEILSTTQKQALETRQLVTTEVQKQSELTRTAAILNRETTVRENDNLTIRYRTYTGLQPTVNIYSPIGELVESAAMNEVSTQAGIYEHAANFSWGTGDFNIVCSESVKGTLDAIIITVVKTDIEDVSGMVSAIMGTTAGISDLKTVADTLNTQFGVIETALSKVGRDLAKEDKDEGMFSNAIDSVYSQLAAVAGQIKSFAGNTNVSLEKLYEVSSEKKQDMTYLKNKTQELKAVVDLSNKMIDNIANKPVTQTWYEYK